VPDAQTSADHFGKSLAAYRHAQLQGLANIVDGFCIQFRAKERSVGGLPFSTFSAKGTVAFVRT
jgi:hypothetical protein